jgi:hypothetical protein
MAIYSTVLFTDKNRQLQTKNKRQKKKKVQRRSYIAQQEVLTVQEGFNQLQRLDFKCEEGFTDQLAQPAQPQTHAPSMCSIYGSLEHTAHTCAQRVASN